MNRNDIEVWKNTAMGSRWYVDFDVQGRETHSVVLGNKTFTLPTLARQVNQEKAEKGADLFRDGTFVLVKPGKETNEAEFDSPDTMTDLEIETLSKDILTDHIKVGVAIADIGSVITLSRLMEQFVIDDLPSSVIGAVKAKIDKIAGTVPERKVVSTSRG